MGYWQNKVLPKIMKVFDTKAAAAKKAAAAEATKSFDDSKEEISKEFEEKKTELQPKAVEIYEAASPKLKTLVKEPKEAGLKKNSTDVQKFLDELVKIEFPGSKVASETFSKFGASYASGPVFFVFEKVSTFIVTEEKPAEEPATTTTTTTEKEIVTETQPSSTMAKDTHFYRRGWINRASRSLSSS
uniref:Plasma membrane-associated cation-binding protein 1 n=1 Tax=Kalanchoe fedtschenkoi TaxID=63787 RepID=A0A7N0UB08_KALFE